ncbi:hypothetical protein KY290_025370 [Solanum tuberosum]|uniref:Cytochrome P450 n=1 Tax=Solanum tuberosum TaxID=4113 RepID=A0ABQ7UTD0_SOLTU|nr:hypothetical protein KY290_025370 [Solanum tuberosum]
MIYWTHPGGPAWGSMYMMTGLAHQKIANMAEFFKAKRLMSFSLGETRFIVTCNHVVAKEVLNSTAFVARPVNESAYGLMFDRAIGFAPYGIKVSESQRFEIAKQMVAIFNGSEEGLRVRDVVKKASLNNMMCSVFGRKYSLVDYFNDETEEVSELVDEGYDILGILNWSDHLPWLAEFDPQKIKYRCEHLVPKVNRLVGRIIDEHRAQPSNVHRDFVDVLLSLQGVKALSDSDMIAVLWEMIFRGSDTVAILIEWILARMVLHPDVQSKVQEEVDRITERSRSVIESDVTNMVYLQSVVNEVLRLHPPGPLLAWARLAIEDTTVDGYHVPAGTTAMVNMWAITRSEEVWNEPLEFKPERFMSQTEPVIFSVLGSDLRLAPFGSGRRSCPGKTLGLTTVTFWVALLLQEFEFGTTDGSKTVDLSEVLRLSCEMKTPLMVKVQPRNLTN